MFFPQISTILQKIKERELGESHSSLEKQDKNDLLQALLVHVENGVCSFSNYIWLNILHVFIVFKNLPINKT